LSTIFETRIEYLKGVGPQKAELLNKELGIFTYGDLLQHYPFRYEDRSTFLKIKDLHEELEHVQVMARIKSIDLVGMGTKKRLVAVVVDETGEIRSSRRIWPPPPHYQSQYNVFHSSRETSIFVRCSLFSFPLSAPLKWG
jgi:RecG-like helicase